MPPCDAGSFKLGAVFVIDADLVEFICCHGGHSLLDCGHNNATEVDMATLKLEAGKSYRNVKGEKCVVLYDDGTPGFNFRVSHPGLELWHSADGSCGSQAHLALIAEWTDAPTGPVRTVARKEIVPGEYGMVQIREPRDGCCFVNMQLRKYTATELRAAIATLTEIAEALEEQE